MNNYFSKFSIEESDKTTFKVNQDLLIKQHFLLNVVLFTTLLLLLIVNVNHEWINWILRVFIGLGGMGLYSYLQFYFTKKHTTNLKTMNKEELLSIRKEFEPSFILITLVLLPNIMKQQFSFYWVIAIAFYAMILLIYYYKMKKYSK